MRAAVEKPSATGVPLEDRRSGGFQRPRKRHVPAPLVLAKDRRCARTERGRPPRERSARRRSRPGCRGRRPCAGSPPAAENPFRRTARRRAGPRAAAWRRPSRRRRNGPAALRLPSARTRPRRWTWVAKPVRVDVGDRRHPQKVAARIVEHARILVLRGADSGRSPRPRRTAAGLTKIDRRDLVGAPLGLLDQRHMPGVERAHRRHQREPARQMPARARANSSLLRTICTRPRASVNLCAGRRLHMRRGKDQA